MRWLFVLVATACAAHPRARIATIHVVDESGAPVEGASVTVIEGHGPTGEVPSRAEQRVIARDTGAMGITTVPIDPGYGPMAAVASRADRPVQVAGFSRDASAAIVLGPARTIAGHIDRHGCSAPLRVKVNLFVTNVRKGSDWLRHHVAQPDVPVDAAGDFEVTLGSGRYMLTPDGCSGETALVSGSDTHVDLSKP